MKKLVIILSLQALSLSLLSQQSDFPKLTGPYLGQKPPGMTPEIFAPGIVSSSEAMEYGMAFAPDGKEFYFNKDGVGVMVCTLSDTGWTAPVKAPFLKKYKGGAVHISEGTGKEVSGLPGRRTGRPSGRLRGDSGLLRRRQGREGTTFA